MSKLDKDTVIENFIQAYTKANGKAPSVEDNSGWYSVNGDTNVRLAELEEMTEDLTKSKPAKQETSKTAGNSEPSAEKEPSAKKKTTAKKGPTEKKSGTQTFSVKDFYTEQIQAKNSGAQAPR